MSDTLLSEVKNQVGVLTLHAPKKLNSLGLDMIKAMTKTLQEWEDDPNIKAVILKSSSERAFCAGGDVKSLYFDMLKSPDLAKDFFKNEYFLDHYIHTYKKPMICFANGITMGGGIGIMNGCSHRIVTETTMMAMPEITIGLFPDVGGTYFLNKMPSNIGLFLGLTGARINGADALSCHLADFLISSKELKGLEEKLIQTNWVENNKENYNITRRILIDLHHPELIHSELLEHEEEIKQLTHFEEFNKLYQIFNTYISSNDWIQNALENFRRGSPTSAKVIFKQIREGKGLSLQEVFKRELTMAYAFSESDDFKEGIRALLVDKDNDPKWSPMPGDISKYFNN